MFGSDVVVVEPPRAVHRQLDDLLGAGVKPISPVIIVSPRPMMNSTAERTLGSWTPMLLEDARRDAVAFADETEQEMLRPDVVVVEALGLFLGEGQGPCARAP